MSDPHQHDHDDHEHPHSPVSDGGEVGEYEILTMAVRELLIEKGVIAADEVRQAIEKLESPGLHLGARIVARAWTDPAFKARLLADGKIAASELGIAVGEAQLIVVENTPDLHNLVVCTLCSCYPRSVLGQPPAWYISKEYRARAVREPRQVIGELGWTVPDGVELRVHDSNADMRYLVLPMRPEGTGGFDEERLQAFVTRDSLIGVGPARLPE